MKQIGLGFMQYTQDYDEKYPANWNCQGTTTSCPAEELVTDTSKPSGIFITNGNSSGSGHYRTWMDFIHPYVKSVQLFTCPSHTGAATTASYGYSVGFGGYATYHTNFDSTLPAGPGYIPISMAVVTRPAEVIMVTEYNLAYSYTSTPYNMSNNANQPNNNIVTPHLDGGNQIFADGHAKWWSRGMMLANVGTTNAGCILTAPVEANAYCSKSWNPYRQ